MAAVSVRDLDEDVARPFEGEGGPSRTIHGGRGVPLVLRRGSYPGSTSLHRLRYNLYMLNDLTVSEARAALGPVTSRAEYGGETTYLTKHGRRTAAVVPAAAAELLEQIEDLIDAEAVRSALADLEAGREQALPFARRTTSRIT